MNVRRDISRFMVWALCPNDRSTRPSRFQPISGFRVPGLVNFVSINVPMAASLTAGFAQKRSDLAKFKGNWAFSNGFKIYEDLR